jgi:stage II sporulation protein D
MAHAASARLGRLAVVVRGWTGTRLYADRPVRVRIASRGHPTILSLPLEEYVAGTVTAETGAAWPAEALQAQAVASRTYALHRMLRPRGFRHDLTGSTLDQVFRPGAPVPATIAAAVDATRGVYLTAATVAAPDDLAPINALFHASCGGATDTAASVWGEAVAESGQP